MVERRPGEPRGRGRREAGAGPDGRREGEPRGRGRREAGAGPDCRREGARRGGATAPLFPTAPGGAPGQATDLVVGVLDRVTYHNDDNGFTVAVVERDGSGGPATIVGLMLRLKPGARLRLWGEWVTHPRFGRQFAFSEYREELPSTEAGMRNYLASGLIPGIGPVTAENIVRTFGPDTMTVLESAPERLREVPGVGPRRAQSIGRAWQAERQIKAIMVFLQSHGVSPGLAVKIFKRYGDAAADKVREDPYCLARDLTGVGFKTADRIAASLGVAPDDPSRIDAGLMYSLGALVDEGHVFVPRSELRAAAAAILAVDAERIETAIDRLAAGRHVVLELAAPGRTEVAPAAPSRAGHASASEDASSVDQVREAGDGPSTGAVWPGATSADDAVYLPVLHRAETESTHRLFEILRSDESRLGAFRSVDFDAALRWVDARLPFPLATRQQDAVRATFQHKVCIVTGGPGTGKTTTVRAILALASMRQAKVALAAPTGRAAKRLAEASGLEAKTIHRLLEFKPQLPGLFARDALNPIPADLVIVDEVSMVDMLLLNALLRAVDPASHLLLVGDADQLPSVGPGNVLADLIECRALPVVALDQLFRQPEGSLIVTNAHRINHGEMPVFASDATDFFLFPVEDPERAAERVVDVVVSRIPARFGLDPIADVQVLSPMHRGAAGVTALNERLRDALNPGRPGLATVEASGRSFRLGDKVMQIRNNYEKGVFNGDLGRIEAIDLENHVVIVRFDDRPVVYEYAELDEIVLAFACSTHKSQGAEYPAVVMAILPAHHVMLQRNLLYTGVTRAKRLCVLVGSRRAIERAVSNDHVAKRHSMLGERLRRLAASPHRQ